MQIAHTFADERRRQHFQTDEAGAIQALDHRQHHAGGHALCPQALMTVTQRDVDELDTLGHADSHDISGYCDDGCYDQRWLVYFAAISLIIFSTSAVLTRPATKSSCAMA